MSKIQKKFSKTIDLKMGFSKKSSEKWDKLGKGAKIIGILIKKRYLKMD